MQEEISQPMLPAINFEVQWFNSRMVLERQPPHCNLIDSAFIKCEADVTKKKPEAVMSQKVILK